MTEYINKEVLIQTLKDNTTEMESDIYYGSNMGIPEDEVENIVNEVPTEDVVEVKHGYWRPKYIGGTLRNGMVSSCCDMWNERPTPFCPHCGAKMDGKEVKKMTDKYDFMCLVDDIFKECETISDLNFRFIEMRDTLISLFNQNVELKVLEDKKEGGIHE